MLEAARSIEAYAARGREEFDNDSAVRDTILYQIVVLGEAAKVVAKGPASLGDELSEDELSLLSRMRDRVAHRYWETDHEIVWSTAINDIPPLITTLDAAINRLT
jgi:uncharacterized protein with HEPN domain